MNRLENLISKWNFKKIAVVYIIVALIAGIGCILNVWNIYRERLDFAFQYAKLEESAEKDDVSKVKTAIDKTASASSDVTDILMLDKNNNVIYSAKGSEFASGNLELKKAGDEKKYLVSADFPDTVFKYVKNDEFMLNSIINKDFGKIRDDYDDDSFYDSGMSDRNVFMISCIKNQANKIYVISAPTSVSGGMTALKITAAAAMFFFMIYWVLVAMWMYKDASKSKLPAVLWGLIGLFTNLIGLIVYKIYKRGIVSCQVCGAAQNASHLYCSYCGAQLGKRCDNCGSKVGAKDSFCHHCGNKID